MLDLRVRRAHLYAGASANLWSALAAPSARIVAHLLSLRTGGTPWIPQQTQLYHSRAGEGNLARTHQRFLRAVTRMPSGLGRSFCPPPTVWRWPSTGSNITLLVGTPSAGWRDARACETAKAEVTEEMSAAL